jgi:TPR repeat protein
LKFSPYLLPLLLTSSLAFGVTAPASPIQATSESVAQFKEQALALSGAVFAQMANGQQSQSRAIVSGATVTTTSGISSVMSSSELTAISKDQSKINRDNAASVDDKQIRAVRMALPNFATVVHESKSGGGYISVSADGATVIQRLQDIPKLKGLKLNEALNQVNAYASKGNPEALNYLGFIYEHGLFNVSQDQSKANAYYEASARGGYQPAILNLAIANLYGKGYKPSIYNASLYADKAMNIGKEPSNRVCGIASFINFRMHKNDTAVRYAQGCSSALVGLATSTDKSRTATERIKALESSISTGLDDAFSAISTIANEQKQDGSYIACKYTILNKYRWQLLDKAVNVEAMGELCASQSTFKQKVAPGQGAMGKIIANFVTQKIDSLKRERVANQFMYGWSVPYLPFTQADVVTYKEIITKTTGQK